MQSEKDRSERVRDALFTPEPDNASGKPREIFDKQIMETSDDDAAEIMGLKDGD